MNIKTNFHFHCHEDEKIASYNIYQYIDHAKERSFDILAYTPHRKFYFKQEYADYALQKGLILIPGIEMEINKRHILVLNCDKNVENIKTFADLKDYKSQNPQIFIIAPHPFVLDPKSLRKWLIENIELFDAIELTIFSNKIFDFNKKAEKVAKKYNKPLIANSDTHFLSDIKRAHSLINAELKTAESVFGAIKNGNLQNKISPMGPLTMIKHQFKAIFNYFLWNLF